MANEVSITNNGDLRIASILNQEVHRLLVANEDIRNLSWKVDSPASRGSLAVKIPQTKFNDIMAAPGESTAVDPTALEDDTATVTAARQSLRYDVSDEFNISNSNTSIPEIAQEMFNAYTRRTTTMLTTLFASFATTAGTTGTVLTTDNIMSAMYSLTTSLNDGPVACVLHPEQLVEFQASLRGEGLVLGRTTESQDMMRFKTQGYVGSWNGIDFYTTSLVSDDGTDYSGAMYTQTALAYTEPEVGGLISQISGSFASQIVGESSVWVEIDRTAESALTKIVGHGYFGVVENEDLRGVEILSVA